MSSLKLLLLEDSKLDAELILRELKGMEQDFETRIITQRNEFERELIDWQPDLIISDFNLHTFSGDEALAYAKKIGPETPFITLSGSITKSMEVTLLEERADDVLTKDNLRRLPFAINRVLNEKKDKDKLNSILFELEDNLKFQEALAEISQKFNSAGEFHNKVNSALRFLGKTADVSRVYIFEDFEEGTYCKNTYEWCAEGVEPQIELLQKVNYSEDIPSWGPALSTEGRIYASNVDDLPQDLQDILKPQDIQAIIVYPLQIQNKFIGFIGFDETRAPRDWNKSEDRLLKSVSGIISNALSERAAVEELEYTNEQLNSLLKEKEALVGEVHHRVKNNLALISSFLQLEQLGVIKSESINQIVSANILRIKSISIVHETVYQQGSFSNIDVLGVVKEIIRVSYLEKRGMKPTISLSGTENPVTFNINSAVSLSLLISELMFQVLSLNYDDAHAPGSEMSISASENQKVITVSIYEQNLAFLLEKLHKEDDFSEIIEVLTKQINAKLEVIPAEGKITITFSGKSLRGSSSTLTT